MRAYSRLTWPLSDSTRRRSAQVWIRPGPSWILGFASVGLLGFLLTFGSGANALDYLVDAAARLDLR